MVGKVVVDARFECLVEKEFQEEQEWFIQDMNIQGCVSEALRDPGTEKLEHTISAKPASLKKLYVLGGAFPSKERACLYIPSSFFASSSISFWVSPDTLVLQGFYTKRRVTNETDGVRAKEFAV